MKWWLCSKKLTIKLLQCIRFFIKYLLCWQNFSFNIDNLKSLSNRTNKQFSAKFQPQRSDVRMGVNSINQRQLVCLILNYSVDTLKQEANAFLCTMLRKVWLRFRTKVIDFIPVWRFINNISIHASFYYRTKSYN